MRRLTLAAGLVAFAVFGGWLIARDDVTRTTAFAGLASDAGTITFTVRTFDGVETTETLVLMCNLAPGNADSVTYSDGVTRDGTLLYGALLSHRINGILGRERNEIEVRGLAVQWVAGGPAEGFYDLLYWLRYPDGFFPEVWEYYPGGGGGVGGGSAGAG